MFPLERIRDKSLHFSGQCIWETILDALIVCLRCSIFCVFCSRMFHRCLNLHTLVRTSHVKSHYMHCHAEKYIVLSWQRPNQKLNLTTVSKAFRILRYCCYFLFPSNVWLYLSSIWIMRIMSSMRQSCTFYSCNNCINVSNTIVTSKRFHIGTIIYSTYLIRMHWMSSACSKNLMTAAYVFHFLHQIAEFSIS